MLMYLYVLVCTMFVCNLFITAPSDFMNSSKTHQDVLSTRHWLLPRCMPSFVCVILCALTIIILLTMTDNDVLHKGSLHLHTHINKSYKTKTNIQITVTTYCAHIT